MTDWMTWGNLWVPVVILALGALWAIHTVLDRIWRTLQASEASQAQMADHLGLLRLDIQQLREKIGQLPD